MKRRDDDVDGMLFRPAPADLGPLFDEPVQGSPPRLHHGVDTSQAEERRLASRSGRLKQTVRNYLLAHGPKTRRELASETGIAINSICPTVDALRRDGLVAELDDKRDGGHLLRAFV